eukprot:766523-Hanusia_phi.AAC.10
MEHWRFRKDLITQNSSLVRDNTRMKVRSCCMVVVEQCVCTVGGDVQQGVSDRFRAGMDVVCPVFMESSCFSSRCSRSQRPRSRSGGSTIASCGWGWRLGSLTPLTSGVSDVTSMIDKFLVQEGSCSLLLLARS